MIISGKPLPGISNIWVISICHIPHMEKNNILVHTISSFYIGRVVSHMTNKLACDRHPDVSVVLSDFSSSYDRGIVLVNHILGVSIETIRPKLH